MTHEACVAESAVDGREGPPEGGDEDEEGRHGEQLAEGGEIDDAIGDEGEPGDGAGGSGELQATDGAEEAHGAFGGDGKGDLPRGVERACGAEADGVGDDPEEEERGEDDRDGRREADGEERCGITGELADVEAEEGEDDEDLDHAVLRGPVRFFDERGESLRGRAGVDGGGGEGEPLVEGGRAPGHEESGGGVEEDHISAWAWDSGENIACDADGVLEVVGLDRADGHGREAEGSRVDGGVEDASIAEFGDVGGSGGGDFVEAFVAVDDHGPKGTEAEECGGHFVEGGAVIDAEELVSSVGGVGEWTKEIEDGGKGERFADGGGVPCGGVVVLGEAKADGGAVEAACLNGGIGIDFDPEGGEEFGGAASAAAFVAVLGNADEPASGGGGDECGDGGDVEGFGGAAGAAGVEEDPRCGAVDRGGMSADGAGGASEFVRGCAAGLDESEEGGDLGLGHVPLEDEFKGGIRLGFGEGSAGEEDVEEMQEVHGGKVWGDGTIRKAWGFVRWKMMHRAKLRAPRSMAASREVARRALVRDLMMKVGRAMTVACAISLGMVGVEKVWSMPGWWAWATLLPPGVAVLMAGALAWRGRWTLGRAAAEADAACETRDAIRTALELAERDDDPFARLAVERGERAASEVRADRVVGKVWHGSWMIWPALAVAGALAWAFVPGMERARRGAEATREQIASAVEDVREAVRAVTSQEPASGGVRESKESHVEELRALEEELKAGKIDPTSARSRAAEVLQAAAEREAAKLEEARRAAEDAIARLSRAAGSSEDEGAKGGELRQALSKGDVRAAAEAIERLRGQSPRLTAEERAKLAKDLEDLATALEAQERAEEKRTTEAPPTGEAGGEAARPEVASERKDVGERRAEREIGESLREASRALREPEPAVKSAERPEGSEGENNKNEAIPPKAEKKSDGKAADGAPKGTGEEDKEHSETKEGSPREAGGKPSDPAKTSGDRKTNEGKGNPEPKPGPSGESGSRDPTTGEKKQGEGNTKEDGAERTPRKDAEPTKGAGSTKEEGAPRGEAREKKPDRDEVKEGKGKREDVERPEGRSPAPDGAKREGRDGEKREETSGPGVQERGGGEKKTLPEARKEGGVEKSEELMDKDGEEKKEGGAKPDPSGGMPKLPEKLPPIPKMSDEALEQLAKRFRDLSKNFERNPASQEQVDRLRRQAEQLLEKSTPEQREQLERLAKRLAKEMPTGEEEATPARPDGHGDEVGVDDAGKPASTRAGGDERAERGRGEGGEAGERVAPRRLGPTPEAWRGETDVVDARAKSQAEDGAPRVLAEVINPNGPERRGGRGEGTIGQEIREAAKGAEKALEQQGVPSARSEYIRRVFRKYLEQAGRGGTTETTRDRATTTPDAADASKSPKK